MGAARANLATTPVTFPIIHLRIPRWRTAPRARVLRSRTAAGNGGVFLLNPQDNRFRTPRKPPCARNLAPVTAQTARLNIGLTPVTSGNHRCFAASGAIYTLTVAAGQDLLLNGGNGIIPRWLTINHLGHSASVPGRMSTTTHRVLRTILFYNGQNVTGQLTILPGRCRHADHLDNARPVRTSPFHFSTPRP